MSTGKKASLTIIIILVAIAGLIAGLELSNTTHIFHQAPSQENQITKAGNFSNLNNSDKTDSSNTPSGNKTPNDNTDHNVGSSTDTGGQTSPKTDESQWISSKSGEITVKQPIADAVLSNGFTLAGTAKVDEVSYNLLDNKVGLISRGVLKVTDGKFSGDVNFKTTASDGRLDIFSTAANGKQLNEIEIAVKF